MRKILLYGSLSLLGLLLAGAGYIAWKLRPRVDPIPEVLPELAAGVDPLDLTIPAQGGLPPLSLRALKGKVAYFVVESRESMQSREASGLKRQLVLWEYPDHVVGYSIGDAEGFGVMAGRIERDFLGPMRPEMPRPLYADYDGAFMTTFNMPRGHVALIVLGKEGEILLRHSGEADEAKLAEIKAILEARDPPEPPPAPRFELEGFGPERCESHGCLFVFLDKRIEAASIPGMPGSNHWSMASAFEAMAEPGVRLLALANGIEGGQRRKHPIAPGVIVGPTDAAEIEGWLHVEQAPELRAAFEVPEGAAALVAVDRQGRIVLREVGRIPLWRLGLLPALMGLEGDPAPAPANG